MDFTKNIAELLHEHDCVILPQFGGFVCNHSPTYIHTVKNQFHAPYKKISFNKNLLNNDGLLANKISQKERISYLEANTIIANSVIILKHELEHRNRVEFKNIGLLYYGKENTLLFNQDETINYLPDSFGRNTFFASPIKRISLESKIEKHFIDRTVTIPSMSRGNIVVHKKNKLRYISTAAAILLGGSLLMFGTKNFKLNNNFANLNPFTDAGKALYQPQLDAIPNIITEQSGNLLALYNGKPDTIHYLNILINGGTPIVISLEQDKTQVNKTTTLKNSSNGTYHIIAGAFSMPENAEKLAAKLKKTGYDDACIIDKKLYIVSYGSFPSRKQALEAMNKIRSTQQDIWLMIN